MMLVALYHLFIVAPMAGIAAGVLASQEGLGLGTSFFVGALVFDVIVLLACVMGRRSA